MATQSYNNDDQMSLPVKHSRLMIDITPDLHRRIEKAATQSDLSIHEYVGNILEQTVPPETDLIRKQRGLNSEAVEDLLRTSEEIMRAHPDTVFEDSAEILHEMREERTRELEQL